MPLICWKWVEMMRCCSLALSGAILQGDFVRGTVWTIFGPAGRGSKMFCFSTKESPA